MSEDADAGTSTPRSQSVQNSMITGTRACSVSGPRQPDTPSLTGRWRASAIRWPTGVADGSALRRSPGSFMGKDATAVAQSGDRTLMGSMSAAADWRHSVIWPLETPFALPCLVFGAGRSSGRYLANRIVIVSRRRPTDPPVARAASGETSKV